MEGGARDAAAAAKWLDRDPTQVVMRVTADGHVAAGRDAERILGETVEVSASLGALAGMASGHDDVLREMMEPPPMVWQAFEQALDPETIRRVWTKMDHDIEDTFRKLLELARDKSLTNRTDILKRLMVENKVNVARGYVGPIEDAELAIAMQEVELEELDREKREIGHAGKNAVIRTRSMSGRLDAKHGGLGMKVHGEGDSMSGWRQLSPDLKQQILGRVGPRDVASASRVCWNFRTAAQEYLGKIKHVNLTQLMKGRGKASRMSNVEQAIFGLRSFPSVTSLGLRGMDVSLFFNESPDAWERLWRAHRDPQKVQHVDCRGAKGFDTECLATMLEYLPRLNSLDLGGVMAHPGAPNNRGLDELGVAGVLGDARRVPVLEKLVLPGSASCTGKLNSGGGRSGASHAGEARRGRVGSSGGSRNASRSNSTISLGASGPDSRRSSAGTTRSPAGTGVIADCVTPSSLQALLAMPSSPPVLTDLDISGCHAVTAEALKLCIQRQFAQRVRGPPRYLNPHTAVDHGLNVLRANNLGKLTSLSLDLADPGAAPLTQLLLTSCPRLEHVDISSPVLEVLSLSQCKCLKNLHLRAPCLSQLNASGCTKLQSVGVSRFPAWKPLRIDPPVDGLLDLEKLNLFGCRVLADDVLHALLLRCARGTHPTRGPLIGSLTRLIADGCISLVSVNLSGLDGAPNLKALKTLSLSGCPSLFSVVTAPSCHELSTVDVHACRNLRKLDIVRRVGLDVEVIATGCVSLSF